MDGSNKFIIARCINATYSRSGKLEIGDYYALTIISRSPLGTKCRVHHLPDKLLSRVVVSDVTSHLVDDPNILPGHFFCIPAEGITDDLILGIEPAHRFDYVSSDAELQHAVDAAKKRHDFVNGTYPGGPNDPAKSQASPTGDGGPQVQDNNASGNTPPDKS
jgi:hypothetical protein